MALNVKFATIITCENDSTRAQNLQNLFLSLARKRHVTLSIVGFEKAKILTNWSHNCRKRVDPPISLWIQVSTVLKLGLVVLINRTGFTQCCYNFAQTGRRNMQNVIAVAKFLVAKSLICTNRIILRILLDNRFTRNSSSV